MGIKKGCVTMPLPQKQMYTESDYYALPEDIRAELIDGQIYYQAAPSRAHQEILSDLHAALHQGCTGAPDWIIEIVSPGNSSHDYIREISL